jgi:hypothetical protein
MAFIRRILYLFYYLKESDWKQLVRFLRYASASSGKSNFNIILDSVISAFKYNISFKDYYCFRFYERSHSERGEWAGTGFMYEYQLSMNPKGSRELLENKVQFLAHYRLFVKRMFLHVSYSESDILFLDEMLLNPSGKLVLKGSKGQVGAEVEVVASERFTPQKLLSYMKQNNYDLAEEFVRQHPALDDLSPSGLNTIRIITQLDNDKVIFLAARLRISVNSPVDNMAAGNIAAPVDLKTGTVTGPGVFSDITRDSVRIHPVTGKEIEGFRIPHWEKVLELVGTAARDASGNKSVGWDIAVTVEGAELIEGNHNWCKLLWQLPVNRGLKAELLRFQ